MICRVCLGKRLRFVGLKCVRCHACAGHGTLPAPRTPAVRLRPYQRRRHAQAARPYPHDLGGEG